MKWPKRMYCHKYIEWSWKDYKSIMIPIKCGQQYHFNKENIRSLFWFQLGIQWTILYYINYYMHKFIIVSKPFGNFVAMIKRWISLELSWLSHENLNYITRQTIMQLPTSAKYEYKRICIHNSSYKGPAPCENWRSHFSSTDFQTNPTCMHMTVNNRLPHSLGKLTS